MQIDQPHDLDWRDGVPVSRRFDDPFYSLEDGLAEARTCSSGATTCRGGSATGSISPSSVSAPG
jgi:tRNA U34 5-methylaminomethyl-2-thiouridine-forming methyltransferase MnmC